MSSPKRASTKVSMTPRFILRVCRLGLFGNQAESGLTYYYVFVINI